MNNDLVREILEDSKIEIAKLRRDNENLKVRVKMLEGDLMTQEAGNLAGQRLVEKLEAELKQANKYLRLIEDEIKEAKA